MKNKFNLILLFTFSLFLFGLVSTASAVTCAKVTVSGDYYYQCDGVQITQIAHGLFGDTITNFASSSAKVSWSFYDGIAKITTPYTSLLQSYSFGGMYVGSLGCSSFNCPGGQGVFQLLKPNIFTGAHSCPAGYTSNLMSSINMAGQSCACGVSVNTCTANLSASPQFYAYWGGMYSDEYNNPLTGGKSCPSGYITSALFGLYTGSSTGVYASYCYASSTSANKVSYFGGSYAQGSTPTPLTNFITSNYSCPVGYASSTIGGTLASPLKLCYQAPPVCGNGVVESGEQCDNGSYFATSGGGCTSICTFVQTTLSATTSAPCGGKIKLSWGGVTGATSYKIFKNNLLLSTTTATSTEVVALATDTFIFKSTVGSVDSASSTPPVSATPSASCFSASCSVNPTSTTTGQLVTWTATSTGAVGPVTYKWIGDEFVNGKTTASVSGIYSTSTPSVKHATTTVSDGVSTSTIGCPGTVSSGGGGIIITDPVNNGVCVTGGQYMTKPTNPYLCLYGTPNPNPVNGGVNGPWWWDCNGNGPGHTDEHCIATKLDPLDPNLTCTLTTASSTISVNNSSTWVATSTKAFTQTRWTTHNSFGTSTPVTLPGNTLNKIFTTVGLVNVTAEIASSTPGVFGPPCTASATVVFGGGGIIER